MNVPGLLLSMGLLLLAAMAAGSPDPADSLQSRAGSTNVRDLDKDGIPDITDNCQLIVNRRQRDSDEDGIGNRCDPHNDCPARFGRVCTGKRLRYAAVAPDSLVPLPTPG